MNDSNDNNINDETDRFLDCNNPENNCCVCCKSTKYITKCCRLNICEICYFDWLKTSRECMHCKQDQLEFNEWYENYSNSNNNNNNNSFQNLFNAFGNGAISGNLLPGFTAMATFVNANDEVVDNITYNLTPDQVLNMFYNGNTIIDGNGNGGNGGNTTVNFADMMNSTINPENLLLMLNMMNNVIADMEDRLYEYENFINEETDEETDE